MDLTTRVDATRVEVSAAFERSSRSDLGQFLTPAAVARLMASMIGRLPRVARILEPGAGVGSLVAAAVEELCGRPDRPERIEVVAYEVDPELITPLGQTLDACEAYCARAHVAFSSTVIHGDFLELTCGTIRDDLFGARNPAEFDLVITNPPYRKMNVSSRHRQLVRAAGLETSNLYSAFAGVALQMLAPGGEIIAITPRSFCNGRYFRPFRELLLSESGIRRIHVFESRKDAFREDSVLQENIIWRAVRGGVTEEVFITSSNGNPLNGTSRKICPDQLVWPGDPEKFIHVAPDEGAQAIADAMRELPATLSKLGLTVSTGRVVDFRASEQLRRNPEPGAVPLLYPTHVRDGRVRWPVEGKKPNALHVDDYTRDQLVPEGVYVLVKRFSAKEERRRIVAGMYDPVRIPSPGGIAFENHLNYIHRNGAGLDPDLAAGLVLYLNSTLADQAFRQFSGHTQVNAGDLRTLSFPDAEALRVLGTSFGDTLPGQEAIDGALEQVLHGIAVS